MIDSNVYMLDRDREPLNIKSIDISANHAALRANMEQLFTEARPRLVRLARLNGIAPEYSEDAVQETLMEAWRHLANLREPQRFNAWLDGICRNICRRQKNTQGNTLSLHELLSASSPHSIESSEMNTSSDILDPLSSEPLEELSQQDLSVLLDRALGYLPSDTRKLMEMCYFAELPQREAAISLGLTIGALELRLHRARRQLRHVLNGELRSEAQSFGLLLDPQDALDWQQTRQWCFLCGKRRMLSRFETRADGHLDFITRCPECSSHYDLVMVHSMGMAELDGLHTFRPALKRLIQNMSRLASWRLTEGKCLHCGELATIKTFHSNESKIPLPSDRYWVGIDCPRCGTGFLDIATIAASNTAVQRFVVQHEHFIIRPYHLIEYNGMPVICVCFTDITSADQITVLLDTQNLHCVAAFSN